jgi:hypothetical protein
VRHCNDVWTVDFKGHFRTADGWRCDPLTVCYTYSRFIGEIHVPDPGAMRPARYRRRQHPKMSAMS